MPKSTHVAGDEAAIKPSFKKPSLIINSAAGSTTDISEEAKRLFLDHDYAAPEIHLVEPAALDEAFEAVQSDGTDLLVIYGGDGTCKAGAIVAREAGIPLIALPGGTMNMLPKALYDTDDWQIALDLALTQKQPRWQAAGAFNQHIFFCGAIVGDPISMSEARESLRDGEVLEALKQLPDIITDIAHGERFEFKVDGKVFDREANGLQIYCPYMTLGATSADAFELASVPQLSMSELVGIGAKAMTQDWRDSIHVKTAFAQTIGISGQGAFDVLLDGEPEEVLCPVTIKLDPQGVLVLAPDLNAKAS